MDFESRKVIEALRSGIPSRTIGGYFGAARSELIAEMSEWLDSKGGNGKILTGNYGEGKTHLLNTVFNIAQRKNMAVSIVSISRETPLNNLNLLYQKIVQNTYLPYREQPGFTHLIDQLNSEAMSELLLFAGKSLQTDKLYYLLKTYSNTDNYDIRFLLMADICGDFITNPLLKKHYKEIFDEKITFSANFAKSRHVWDYFQFVHKLFEVSGVKGWLILFDEAEQVGRLGRRARFNAYINMDKFLNNSSGKTLSLFTMTSNYATEIIDGKDERAYLSGIEGLDTNAIERSLCAIESAPELAPLDREEFTTILSKIIEFYSRAYDFNPKLEVSQLFEQSWSRGHLLRTKIRAAIECLDQLYQYGDTGTITITALEQDTYLEEIPLPEEL